MFRKSRSRYGMVLLLTLLLLILVSCGSEEEKKPLDRVISLPTEVIVDDLRSAGMKVSKQYDVTELPGATEAWYGFIRTEDGPMDVEARFYSGHSDAVSMGTELADEASGEDALIEEDEATWTEGIKDRQRMRSGGTADLAAWSGRRGPNYADFVVYGNVILLCQGDTPQESLETCHELIAAIEEE